MENRAQLAYGESVTVFTNRSVLDAAIADRSYANAERSVACGPQAVDVYLLVKVRGPGSTNPSARFQLGSVYLGLVVGLRSWLGSEDYIEIPIRHVPLVAGDARTGVLEH